MPYYEVHHTVTLTPSQKDEFASRLTTIHTTLFTAPSLFVNIRFTPLSPEALYIGGKPRPKSHILAHVRTSPSRSKADFSELCRQITAAWDEIVVPLPQVKRSVEGGDRGLWSVFVLGDIVTVREGGLDIPEAGTDVAWVGENMHVFKARAEGGEEEFQDLVNEVEERGLLKGHKTTIQRLEEELGWGDSA